MCSIVQFVCFLSLVVLAAAWTPNVTVDSLASDIYQLKWQVRADQWNDTIPITFPLQYGHQRGQFKNSVHFNFVGNPIRQWIRENISVIDNNMFVASFILEGMFESTLFAGDVVEADDLSALLSIQAIDDLRDKNLPSDVPVFGFWPQAWLNVTLANGTVAHYWGQDPINLSGGAQQGLFLDKLLEYFMDLIGEGPIWNEFGPELAKILSSVTTLFQIPSDADDTSVILALNHLISHVKNKIPEAYGAWKALPYNVTKGFDVLLQYAYCPGSSDPDRNSIDPRTYMWAHEYFGNVTNEYECFVSTWLQPLSQARDVARNETAGPHMPLLVSNVDPTVCSNAIYAMSATLLTDEDATWFTGNYEMKNLYLSTAAFVHYAVATQPWQERPDLELLYYPPVYDVVYFVARHLHMLESYLQASTSKTFPVPEMQIVYEYLRNASWGGGLTFTQMNVNTTCWGNTSSVPMEYRGDRCWDGFLGLADTNMDNQSTPHYEDRFFSTSVVLNSLIDVFSYATYNDSDASATLTWVADVPQEVVELMDGAVAYLHHALQDPTTSYENAFFSGSGKYWEEYPFWYPANRRFDVATNLPINCTNITLSDLQVGYPTWFMAASGVMTEAEFHVLKKEGCAGIRAPTWFPGYNGDRVTHDGEKTAWPYWSAPVMSKALALQGLSKYRRLIMG